MIEIGEWRIARDRIASLRGNSAPDAVLCSGKKATEHDWAIGDGAGERLIAVNTLLASLAIGRGDLTAAAWIRAAWAIFLGEQNIETNRRCIGVHQDIDDFCHILARPRPSADAPNRFVVDINDANGLIWFVGARAPS